MPAPIDAARTSIISLPPTIALHTGSLRGPHICDCLQAEANFLGFSQAEVQTFVADRDQNTYEN